jgi:hypothetical protein
VSEIEAMRLGLPSYLKPASMIARGEDIPEVDRYYIDRARKGASEDEIALLTALDPVTIAEGKGGAAYEYDDSALVVATVNGAPRFFLINTSGCSCPSPDETWGIEKAGTLHEVLTWIWSAVRDYDSAYYTSGNFELWKALKDELPNETMSVEAANPVDQWPKHRGDW